MKVEKERERGSRHAGTSKKNTDEDVRQVK